MRSVGAGACGASVALSQSSPRPSAATTIGTVVQCDWSATRWPGAATRAAGGSGSIASAQRGRAASPASTARSAATLCGRCIGRTPSIQPMVSTKPRETSAGTPRTAIGTSSSCTARTVAGAGGSPNSRKCITAPSA